MVYNSSNYVKLLINLMLHYLPPQGNPQGKSLCGLHHNSVNNLHNIQVISYACIIIASLD